MTKKFLLIVISFALLSCNLGGKKDNKIKDNNFGITEAPEESLAYLQKVAIPLNINNNPLLTVDNQLDEDIENARIIVSGEAHLHNYFRNINLDFIKFFYEEYGIRYYLAEMNWIEAIDVNKYINGGDEQILSKLFQRYKYTDLATKETYKFFKDLRIYNLSLPEDKRIVYLGVDIVGPWENLSAFYEFLPENIGLIPDNIKPGITQLVEAKNGLIQGIRIDLLLENIKSNIEEYKNFFGKDFNMFYFTIKISKKSAEVFYSSYTLNDRDKAIYSNILMVMELFPNEKFYGSWGSAHVAKGRHYLPQLNLNYTSWVAHSNKTDSPLYNKVLAFYAFPVNTVSNIGAEEMVDIPDVAARYFEEAAESLGYTHVLFPLNRDNSPFTQGLYLVPGPLDDGVTIDYIDYVLLVNGSEMMESYFEE